MNSILIHKAILVAVIAIIGILLATTVVIVAQNSQSVENEKLQEPSIEIMGPLRINDIPYLLVERKDVRIDSMDIEHNYVSHIVDIFPNNFVAIELKDSMNRVVITCFDKDGNVVCTVAKSIYMGL